MNQNLDAVNGPDATGNTLTCSHAHILTSMLYRLKTIHQGDKLDSSTLIIQNHTYTAVSEYVSKLVNDI